MTIAIIGGTGLSQINGLQILEKKQLSTPFGSPSADYLLGQFNGKDIIFLARHGSPHIIPPHKINYCANIWGLKELGVKKIIAVAAVGGITAAMHPGRIIIPEQIIDYSYGRQHSFFEDNLDQSGQVVHIDFTRPYSEQLRNQLINAAQLSNLNIHSGGVYGCTQGPRLETAAEISRMERDGCDLVGMTGMPEAALARELRLEYATCAIVANWAAGKTEGEITMPEIEQNLKVGIANTTLLLEKFIEN
jgi:5'-methylthioadenosine phosphorylase/5'-methylthioinosine phosphorylase